jgi:uncharacterized membrane protein YoaK (UPF0700 family)
MQLGSASSVPPPRPLAEQAAANLRHPLSLTLLALTLSTGTVDAVSYLGLGHVFTANMTGGAVLLGFGIAHAGGLSIVAPIVSMAAFVVGSAVGGAFGGAAVASILASTVGAGGYPSADGFTIAFAACALVLALGVLAGLAIPPRRPADAFAPHEAGDLDEAARQRLELRETLSR